VRLASEAKPPRNLWKEAEFADVILLSPERLIGKSCQDFIHVDEVWERLCALGVDEIQFLDTWGPTFRTAFLQIANAHRRLRPGTIIIATTATLPSGPPRTRILRHVGLGDVDYHEIHRSNIRPNVRMDFRPLSSGLRGHAFPDLKWLLKDGRKTIIFCQSINLTFRAFVYLWHLCPGTTAEKSTRIRMYTAAHSEAYNSQTRELMHSDPLAQIILATDTLSVGVDFRGIWIVIILGEDQTADMVIQKFGRVARDIRLVREGLAILFFTKNAVKTAQVIVDAGQPAKPDPSRKMDFSMAKMLVAPCLRAVQDELFDNPAEDSICTCTTCTAALADVCASSGTAEQSTTSRTTSTGACNCGRCDPRPLPHTAPPTAPTARGQTKRDPTKLTGLQRQEARARLATLRQQLYLEGIAGDPTLAFSTPPSEFLPSDVADSVLLNWHHISHADDLAPYLSGASLLVTHCARLYDFINDLMPELDAIRKAAAAESTRKRAATVATKKAAKLAAETAADSSLDAVDAAPDVADEALLQHQAAPDVAPDQPSAPANAMDRSCRATGASDPYASSPLSLTSAHRAPDVLYAVQRAKLLPLLPCNLQRTSLSAPVWAWYPTPANQAASQLSSKHLVARA
jgi:hypothetical protein